jgi:hypothetical protein
MQEKEPSAKAINWRSSARGKTDRFISELSALNLPNTFNPWRDNCPENDRTDAPAIRRRNLSKVLEAAIGASVEHFWVGRDLGYLGGRRTGLAMTDELHLEAQAQMWGISALTRATTGQACGERTAKEVWHWLVKHGRPTFLWNVFPLHPHRPGESHSNRPHTRSERDAAIHLLTWLHGEMRPKCVVALGRDAQQVLATMGIVHVPVRHPSMGGLNDFRSAMVRLFAC